MCEALFQNKWFTYRDSLRENRSVKDYVHEHELMKGGRFGKDVEDAFSTALKICNDLEVENSDQIYRFMQTIDPQEHTHLRDAFYDGLKMSISMRQKFLKDNNPDELVSLQDPQYIKSLIEAYSFDFYGLYSSAKKYAIQDATAIEIAKFAYHHNHTLLKNLHSEFPDVPDWVISFGLTKHVKDPRRYIQRYSDTFTSLQQHFPHLSYNTHTRAAAHYTNPEQFLQRLEGLINELGETFPEFDQRFIERIASEKVGHAHNFLAEAQQKIVYLTQKYIDMPEWLIRTEVLKNPHKAQQRLLEIKTNSHLILETFPSLASWFIEFIVSKNASITIDYVQQICEQIDQLYGMYPDIGKGRISVLVAQNPTTAHARIQKIIEKESVVQEEFPLLGIGTIRRALLSRPQSYHSYLQTIQQTRSQLIDQFPQIDRWIINYISEKSIQNTHRLAEIMDTLPSVLQMYSQLPPTVVTRIVIESPTSFHKRLQRMKNTYDIATEEEFSYIDLDGIEE